MVAGTLRNALHDSAALYILLMLETISRVFLPSKKTLLRCESSATIVTMSRHSGSVEVITGSMPTCAPNIESTSQGSGIDSGYSSAAVTPKSVEKVLDHFKSESSKTLHHFRIRLFHVPKATDDLKTFNKHVEKEVKDRYDGISERLEITLVKYMHKSPQDFNPTALRLMVLGTTEEDAKPWIVVLCPAHRVRRVQRFFDKPLARDLCQPKDPDIPCFEIAIFGQPLQMRAGPAIEVYNYFKNSMAADTLCGTLIKSSEGNQTRIGTLGGIIKVIDDDGSAFFYGMTAGHLIEGMTNLGITDVDEPDVDQPDDDDAGDESDWTSADEADDPKDLPDSLEPCGESLPRNSRQLMDAFAGTSQLEMESKSHWIPIGNVSTDASITPQNLRKTASLSYRDWALVEFAKENDLKRNTLSEKSGAQKDQAVDLKLSSKDPSTISSPLHVVMASGLQGIKRGTLSSMPCSVLLGPGRRFVRAYTLKLWDGTGKLSFPTLYLPWHGASTDISILDRDLPR